MSTGVTRWLFCFLIALTYIINIKPFSISVRTDSIIINLLLHRFQVILEILLYLITLLQCSFMAPKFLKINEIILHIISVLFYKILSVDKE